MQIKHQISQSIKKEWNWIVRFEVDLTCIPCCTLKIKVVQLKHVLALKMYFNILSCKIKAFQDPKKFVCIIHLIIYLYNWSMSRTLKCTVDMLFISIPVCLNHIFIKLFKWTRNRTRSKNNFVLINTFYYKSNNISFLPLNIYKFTSKTIT